MKKLSRDAKFILGGEYYIFFLLGIYTLMVGSVVPQIRAEYGVSYEFSGYMISACTTGIIAMNLISSYTAILLGLKRAYIIQHALVIIGYVAVTISGNHTLLILGMVFIGFARGSTSNYSNQIVNDITKSNIKYMNIMAAFFAVGACVAPFVMILSSDVAGNWRLASYGLSIAAAVGIVLTLFMKLNREGSGTEGEKRGGLAFFKRKKYLVSLIAMFFYSGVEISIIGWLVTFFMEVQGTTTQFASAMATLLWASILVGRIVCSLIASRMTAAKFIFVLSVGVAAFMALFVCEVGLALQIAATIGLGLFMSGIYSTILVNTGSILSEFKLAFGYFFMLSGLGPVILPAIIGVIAERRDVLTGVRTLAIAAAALLVISIVNLRLEKAEG